MMLLNPTNHYWIIGASTTDVYASASNTLVAVGDQSYVDWTASNAASLITSEAELADVIKNYNFLPTWLFNAPSFIQPTPTTYTNGQLAAYNADARYRKASGGFTITSINTVPFLTDPTSRNTLASANDYAKVTPHDTDWKFADGTFLPLTPAQLDTAANAIANFVQSCFTKESENLAAIGSGTITTIAQIDTTFSSISSVVP